jgi:glycosyltransferase involved in cell wall biosynthesis
MIDVLTRDNILAYLNNIIESTVQWLKVGEVLDDPQFMDEVKDADSYGHMLIATTMFSGQYVSICSNIMGITMFIERNLQSPKDTDLREELEHLLANHRTYMKLAQHKKGSQGVIIRMEKYHHNLRAKFRELYWPEMPCLFEALDFPEFSN